MRITIVQGPFLPVPPLRGGAVEKVWFALGREFSRRGHAVTHFSRSFPGLEANETKDGVHHIRMSGFDTPSSWRPVGKVDVLWPMRLLLDFIYSLRVRFRLPQADIVVTNAFWLPLFIRRATECGHLYVHIQRYPRAQIRFYRHADRLQTVSSSLASLLKKMLPDAAHRVRVIENPIVDDVSWADEREVIKIEKTRDRVVLFVGRVHPAKGLEVLIEAFARFQKHPENHDWSLRIVGPSEHALGGGGSAFRERLEERSRSLAVPITFVGFVDSPLALRAEYSRAQIFVYPTLDELGEASPVAPIEAMSCGCPVVTSNLACFRDYLENEKTGFLFDHRSTNAVDNLASLLGRLAKDAALRRDVAQRAWHATRRLSLESVADQYLADFAELAPVLGNASTTPSS